MILSQVDKSKKSKSGLYDSKVESSQVGLSNVIRQIDLESMDSDERRKQSQLVTAREQGTLSVVESVGNRSAAKSHKSKASGGMSSIGNLSEAKRRRKLGPQNERTREYLGLNKKKKGKSRASGV